MKIGLSTAYKGLVHNTLKIFCGLSFILTFMACSKSKNGLDLGNKVVISKSGFLDEPINELKLPIKGGYDTIYVFSNSEISIQINGAENWVNVVQQEYISNRKAFVVILMIDTLKEDLTERIASLDISNQGLYSRSFLKLSQGYKAHFNDDFSWLHYGTGDPLDQNTGVPIYDWNPSQKEKGWISDTLEGKDKAFVYGKDGYIQLGTDTVGANLSTPIITGVQNDSLLVLTFNAVAFVPKDGQPDNNELTIRIIGGTFEDGNDEQVITLNHLDNGSALIEKKMWENSTYAFELKKLENAPFSTTIQIKYINGNKKEAAKNRLFIDNVRLFSKMEYQPEINENKK